MIIINNHYHITFYDIEKLFSILLNVRIAIYDSNGINANWMTDDYFIDAIQVIQHDSL